MKHLMCFPVIVFGLFVFGNIVLSAFTRLLPKKQACLFALSFYMDIFNIWLIWTVGDKKTWLNIKKYVILSKKASLFT